MAKKIINNSEEMLDIQNDNVISEADLSSVKQQASKEGIAKIRHRKPESGAFNVFKFNGKEYTRHTMDSSNSSKLDIDPSKIEEGMHYRWVNADASTIQKYELLGYIRTPGVKHTNVGKKGSQEQILMETPSFLKKEKEMRDKLLREESKQKLMSGLDGIDSKHANEFVFDKRSSYITSEDV